MPYDARIIANELLDVADEHGKRLTIMQLLKLIYLAHGWSLALLDEPLISDDVQAWRYGPVIPTVYRAFGKDGGAPIAYRAAQPTTGMVYRGDISEKQKKIINAVVKNYGDKHAFTLSDMTHTPGSPWTQVYNEQGQYSKIPNDIISEYFKKLAEKRSVERHP